MRILVINITLFFILALLASTVLAEGDGGQPAVFKTMALGGRASAMGGAFTAIAEGGVAPLYNPAGIAQSRKHIISFSYRAMQLDRRLGYANFQMPAKEMASFSVIWVHAGTSPLQERDNQGNILTGLETTYSENLIGATFAKLFGESLSLGGKAYYIQNTISNINAYTVGIDFGGLFKLDMRKTTLKNVIPLLRMGMVVENLGATYKWTTTSYWQTRGSERGSTYEEKFPINYRTGIALEKPDKYIFSADFEVNSESQSKLHLGGEYSYRKMLFLRAGLNDGHPTFGTGFLKIFTSFALAIDLSYLTDRVGEGDDILVSFDVFL
ncbi:MAG: PorV/PorQ family protein [candidate division Zixibacteria bacterium]